MKQIDNRNLDLEGTINWAHAELDIWNAPRDSDGAALTVVGRIAHKCAEDQRRISLLRDALIRIRDSAPNGMIWDIARTALDAENSLASTNSRR